MNQHLLNYTTKSVVIKNCLLANGQLHLFFGNIREIAFKSPVRSSLGPNITRLSETQRYHMQENKLIIDNIQILHDIPYGDYFRIEGRWVVTPISPTNVKLVVSLGVNFSTKPMWKSKIEVAVIKETQESYQNWVTLAKQTASSPQALEKVNEPTNITSNNTTINQPATQPAPLITKETKATSTSFYKPSFSFKISGKSTKFKSYEL